ncbi:kinase-like domain-containing protein [Polychytrium aggregatum]|uniref:kinase-like domain-containing protein n=1 Tax=Polychytrium aggregatum TaxID=110093 RepID=UPI0022FE8E08|nr:kinase-like domain-containing protein [Polychytrium aggregatum]KAI9203054.1 kinase-like domain-containing protein [Polychytrium aggregatum]
MEDFFTQAHADGEASPRSHETITAISSINAESGIVGAKTEKPVEIKPRYIGNYNILKTLGEGSFAKVKLAVHRLTNQQVAIKIMDKEKLPDEYSLRNIHREAQIMRMLNHVNIIQLYEVMETRKELFLVLEYAQGGEVLDYIVAHGRLKEPEARKFVTQIISALEHCHSLNIVHRDLKAENLLLGDEMTIKISDFGLSNVFDKAKTLGTCCGSPVYSAPELIEGRRYIGPEVDIWSLGVNVYAMVVGDLPFADSNISALYESILKGKYEIPDFVSAECRDFISKLLVVNPKKRYTCAQIKEHPWLTQGNAVLYSSPPPTVNIRPKTEQDIDMEILSFMESMGFERSATISSLQLSKFNQAAGTYYLLCVQKRQDAQAFSREAEARRLMNASDRASQADHTARPHGSDTKTTMGLAKVMFEIERCRTGAEERPAQPTPEQTAESITQLPVRAEPSTQSKVGLSKRNRSKTVSVGSKLDTTKAGQFKSQHTATKAEHAKHGDDMPNGGVASFAPRDGEEPHSIRPSSSRQQPQRKQQYSLPPISTSTSLEHQAPRSNRLHPATLDLPLAISPTAVTLKPVPDDETEHSGSLPRHTPRTRRRGNTASAISIDDSLYLNTGDDLEHGDGSRVPRTIRFAFNCSTTSSSPPVVLLERLTNALEKSGATWQSDAFLLDCEHGDIRFEVEICKLPRLKMYGLRLKRISGDIWEYKNMCTRITSEFEQGP